MNTDKLVPTRVADLENWLDRFAPARTAEEWDAVGLQIGHPDDPVQAVLLTLDITPEAVRLARQHQASLIICHHPPLFEPLASLRLDQPEQRMLVELAAAGTSVLAAHTNLDQAAGGVADCLAEKLAGAFGAKSRLEPLGPYGRLIVLDKPVRWLRLLDAGQRSLGAGGCLQNTADSPLVRRIGVYPGSFSADFIPDAVAAGAEAVICGECKHSTGLLLTLHGLAQAAFGHDVTERVVLEPLAEKLRAAFPQIRFAVCPGLDYNESAFRVSRTAAGVSRKAAHEESPGSAGQGAG
ncbi:MAG: Nif3-like dinuclear metal center hexameric protein, partial [Clostridiaceae bacterium]|nr:Nif3-like dinuclear metal center hexameric protein [Clostridiaceae bacterium]